MSDSVRPAAVQRAAKQLVVIEFLHAATNNNESFSEIQKCTGSMSMRPPLCALTNSVEEAYQPFIYFRFIAMNYQQILELIARGSLNLVRKVGRLFLVQLFAFTIKTNAYLIDVVNLDQ